MGRGWIRRLGCGALAVTLLAGLLGANRPDASGPLYTAGLLGNATTLLPVAPQDARGLAYLSGSTVLRLPDGRLRYLPHGAGAAVTVAPDDPGALAAAASERAWLAAGTVPGRGHAERAAAARSLLYLRLLLRPGGAAVAAQPAYWAYVWPRDASFAAAAFAATGHGAESRAILGFLARTQQPDGTWPARSRPDGKPVADGRAPQLDAPGWVCWAAWLASDQGGDRAEARRLWPTVRAAADAAVGSLGRGGLPRPAADYWERAEPAPTLGNAAALLVGLHAAARLAGAVQPGAQEQYLRAAGRLEHAVRRRLAGPDGFHHSTAGGGADAAVAWLAPPFRPPDPAVRAAVAEAARQLAAGPDGGVVPGWPWHGADAWTPATASFALAEMAAGDRAAAARRLGWLLAHRTTLGAFPERVRRGDGAPRSVAPIGWTHALVLLTLVSRDRPLPIP
ncbi:MAG TPA: glycoside hydrolase family 15 [Actinomycetes bacterium]